MIEIFIELTLVSFLVACFGNFMYACFAKGMIFRKYYNFITYHLYLKGNSFTKFIYNPLGGCLYCMTTWFSIFYFFIINYEYKLGLLNLFYLFLQIGVTYIATNIINNKLNNH